MLCSAGPAQTVCYAEGMSRRSSVAALQRYKSDCAWLPVLVFVACAACSYTECNSRPCAPPHVEIRFEPAITDPGHYGFEVDADGRRSTCEIDLIMTDGFTGVPGEGFTGASACGALLLAGGVSRDYATEIVGYTLPQATSVSIVLFRGEELWVEHAFTASYRGVEVNGEGCGECTVATERVVLP
jgi:hypothetical protein